MHFATEEKIEKGTFVQIPFADLTNDHGKTWQALRIPQSSYNDSMLRVVQPHPILKGVLFASFYRDLFITENSGSSWRRLNVPSAGGFFGQLVSHPSRPNRIFARPKSLMMRGETLIRSTDGGRRWRELHAPGYAYHRIAIHPRDPDMIVTAGDAIGISTDGGNTWIREWPDREASGLALDPENRNTLYVALPEDADPNVAPALQKSTDLGKTWKYLPLEDGYSISTNPNNGYVFAGSHRKIHRSTDGGNTWQAATGCCAIGPWHFAFHPSNSSIAYAVERAGVYKSTDGGLTWTMKTDQLSAPEQSFEFVYVDPFHPDVVYAGNEGLFVSGDAGETWSMFTIKGLKTYSNIDDLVAPSPGGLVLSQDLFLFSYSWALSSGGPEIYQLAPQITTRGSTLVIVGKHFGSSQGASRVLFGRLDAGEASLWSDTRIEISVPTDSRTAPLSVVVGGKRSNSPEVIVLPSPPAQFAPIDGPSTGQTQVAIPLYERSFPVVVFGSTLAKSLSVQFSEDGRWILTCTTPAGKGTVPVWLFTGRQKVMIGQFQYR